MPGPQASFLRLPLLPFFPNHQLTRNDSKDLGLFFKATEV